MTEKYAIIGLGQVGKIALDRLSHNSAIVVVGEDYLPMQENNTFTYTNPYGNNNLHKPTIRCKGRHHYEEHRETMKDVDGSEFVKINWICKCGRVL